MTALTCTPNPVIGGNTTVCTVTMNGIMVEDTTVSVLSDQPFFVPADGLGDGAGRCGQCRLFPPDDPCP